ncbi:hypothetical protein OA39_03427 [Vibrio campbellii]|uniref:Uncharacterized protein n=1 Tax=Vibrio campbellii (strain ATCC BAA-1116) TaxID=2902295 RepID=A7MVE9_VIBC1|nr:hypothetical protein VIBHAR_02925 [Vibrio campbellii ATCC BAA-1116]AQM69455.1 hypothetical protein Vca1114GL_03025 [Vibrio campbellii]CAD7804848.1 hypothetical protein ACOMICROBIO_LMKGKHOH_01901 [Vibrio sp. B1FIG11]KGR34183.1 hypothetical protein OA39_03427 [Vibrio campbellii]CAE6897972.1 hypothetical protein ACOMICROBIO_LMKGKHOH_01901 [Vibrio sp. B1FIG11]
MHLIVAPSGEIQNPKKTKAIHGLMPWRQGAHGVVLLSIFYTYQKAIIKYGKRSKKTAGNLCPSVR